MIEMTRESMIQRLATVGCMVFTNTTPLVEVYKYIHAATQEFELSSEDTQTLTQIMFVKLMNGCK